MSAQEAGPLTILQLRDAATASVVGALYRNHPELTSRFGKPGASRTREDIGYHVDYLDAALSAAEPRLFTRYARWLRDILESRGVPAGMLAESFALLDDFFARRLPEAEARSVTTMLDAGRDAVVNDTEAAEFQARLPSLPAAAHYGRIALTGNQREALQLVESTMRAGHTLTQTSVRVIQPAMVELGQLWQTNRVTVAQEHLVTAVTQNVLARAYMHAHFAAPLGRKALFAAVEGNHHILGLRILSDAFETSGWDATYLGGDVPTTDLLRYVDTAHPDILGLSLSMPWHLGSARDAIGQLKSELGSRCPSILIGGQVTLLGDRIWAMLDADGWAADALHAIEQIERLPA